MNEKPQKRLVSKRIYVGLMVGRTTLILVSVLFAIVGFAAVVLSYWINSTGWHYWIPSTWLHTEGVCAMTAPVMIFIAFRLYKRERKIERVELITTQNAHLLPPKESLVRASNMPPSQQQAELLRTAQYGKETHAEELLRATTTNEQE
jgi:hypothetical protein